MWVVHFHCKLLLSEIQILQLLPLKQLQREQDTKEEGMVREKLHTAEYTSQHRICVKCCWYVYKKITCYKKALKYTKVYICSLKGRGGGGVNLAKRKTARQVLKQLALFLPRQPAF